MSNFEKKFGKYAIPNLTLILIACYALGYFIELVNADFFEYLTLDPYRVIMKGQIWRIFTWLVIPPSDLGIFTLIMLFFYYSIGTTMERTLGTYKYNVYLIRGMFLTVCAAFLCLGLCYLFPQLMLGIVTDEYKEYIRYLLTNLSAADKQAYVNEMLTQAFSRCAYYFSTYYINISIFLAFAVCYPDMQVLLMFVIPVKVKWMGILDLVLLGYSFVTGNIFVKFAVGTALLNFLIFYLTYRNLSHLRPSQIKRRAEFQHKANEGRAMVTKHKCAICGQTDESNPELEFRFCSKCNGNYEYCSNHLYTHEHVK